MYDLLLAVHLVLAVFTIGPLVHAATTAGRGVRNGDGVATASSARMLRIYGYASALVVIAGFASVSVNSPFTYVDPPDLPDDPIGRTVRQFGQTWIWLSLLLWAVAIGLVLGIIVPTLERATALIGDEESVVTLTGRVAAAGGVIGLLFVVIVFLMVYRPGR